ncbi:4729_t:CDS:2 [Acaulospora morrowiae]|uniref:4729_t:CDS:1 n=1 Tax=Acaulospora morrowiae TaxID=94023 RepID=A0A9N8ZT02_9GLOM|nr:4729_t:CDS:2 [Acaulospora morrowiae]
MTYIESKCFGNSHADDTNSGDAKKSPDISNNNLPEEERKKITRAVINVNKNNLIEVIINSTDQFNKARMSTEQKSQQIYEKLIYIDFCNQDKRRWAPEWNKLCKMYKCLMINSTGATTLPTYYRNHVKKTLPLLKSNNVSAAKKNSLIDKVKNSVKDHQEKTKKNLLDFDQYNQNVVKFRQDIVKFKEALDEKIANSQAATTHYCFIVSILMSFFNYLRGIIARIANYSVTGTPSMTYEYIIKASELLEEFSDSIDEFSGINNIHIRVWDVINSELESFLSTRTVLADGTNKYIA